MTVDLFLGLRWFSIRDDHASKYDDMEWWPFFSSSNVWSQFVRLVEQCYIDYKVFKLTLESHHSYDMKIIGISFELLIRTLTSI